MSTELQFMSRGENCTSQPIIGPEWRDSLLWSPIRTWCFDLSGVSSLILLTGYLFSRRLILHAGLSFPLLSLTGRSLLTSRRCICPTWSWRTWANRRSEATTPSTSTCAGMWTRRETTGSPPTWTDSPYTTPSPAASPSTPPTACWSVKDAPWGSL